MYFLRSNGKSYPHEIIYFVLLLLFYCVWIYSLLSLWDHVPELNDSDLNIFQSWTAASFIGGFYLYPLTFFLIVFLKYLDFEFDNWSVLGVVLAIIYMCLVHGAGITLNLFVMILVFIPYMILLILCLKDVARNQWRYSTWVLFFIVTINFLVSTFFLL